MPCLTDNLLVFSVIYSGQSASPEL